MDIRLLPCGVDAVLIEIREEDPDHALAGVLALDAALRTTDLPVTDLVPAARTLLAQCPAERLAEARAAIVRLAAQVTAEALPRPWRRVRIEVEYAGPDLGEVARLTGLQEHEVVTAHTGTPWRVAFGGFAPGFAYLVGGDPRLQVPRRDAPRTQVPAGAVGLAGRFSGIYPRASPGGWQLLGRTDAVLWDATAVEPALLAPGTEVVFEAIR
ncbi:5-oxoprolinase subunit B family protein [Granulicoccus sp. GXG6511]|uniref:5-oxoprolinase subunit B family protein n=1 Tax=Granulicoccus sp. GXG6511 TaxID=3381351 RepID=UPI003D7DBA6B